ncbi:MAG: hypothetical protein MK135_06335 [Polyangiaceae bacterium]|nr:hypothetical protein [Polyangiaceae bacterium]
MKTIPTIILSFLLLSLGACSTQQAPAQDADSKPAGDQDAEKEGGAREPAEGQPPKEERKRKDDYPGLW